MTKKTNNNRPFSSAERGSIFFYILLGVVLFGALAFTISRGMRSQSTDAMTKRQMEMAASEILSNVQTFANGVDKLRQNSISESDLCFMHEGFSVENNRAYESVVGCTADENKLFHTKGGNVPHTKVPEAWLESSHKEDDEYGEWIFSDQNAVEGIGEGVQSSELIIHINHLKRDICQALNKELGIEGIPENAGSFKPSAPFLGTFTVSGQITAPALSGKKAGCFENTNTWNSYIFYATLIERE